MSVPLSATSSTKLSGYYGHLDRQQQKALDDLKQLLRNDGLQLGSLDDEAHGDRSHGVSDLELLRFLRARKFDVQRSYAMYTAALRWRKEVDLDNLYKTFDWDKAQRAARVGYRQYFHKQDRTGSPVHYHEIGSIDLTQLFKVISPEDQIKFMYLLNESNFRRRFPACTEELRRKSMPKQTTPGVVGNDPDPSEAGLEALEIQEVETVTGVLDIKGVGLMAFWKVKDILTQVIQISDNYYPETSNRMYIINAPSMFSTIWSYIKGLLDQRTASRIFILGSDYKQALLEHIAPENLPARYGGTCTCHEHEDGCRTGDIGCWNMPQTNGASDSSLKMYYRNPVEDV